MELVCPNCRKGRVEWAYGGELPAYLRCEHCSRVIPTPAWDLYGWGPLGGEQEKVRPPIHLQDWEGLGEASPFPSSDIIQDQEVDR